MVIVYDENGNEIKNPDLEIGKISYCTRIKKTAKPLDEKKTVWLDSDYEEFAVFTLFSDQELAEIESSKNREELPKRVDNVEIMTDDLVMMVADIVGVQS